MTDELRRQKELSSLRIDLTRGLAAVRLLLEERSVHNDRLRSEMDDLRARFEAMSKDLQLADKKIAILEERQANQRELHHTAKSQLDKVEDYAIKTPEKHAVEKWKATAPIIVALAAGFFGVVTGIIALITALVKR